MMTRFYSLSVCLSGTAKRGLESLGVYLHSEVPYVASLGSLCYKAPKAVQFDLIADGGGIWEANGEPAAAGK
jgi:hypothetical protein